MFKVRDYNVSLISMPYKCFNFLVAQICLDLILITKLDSVSTAKYMTERITDHWKI